VTSTNQRRVDIAIEYRKPVASDGMAINRLITDCAPLDVNSAYCNLLQCDHFRDTCIVAEIGGEIVGWISAYVKPDSPDTLFVWQVAVSSKARGRGLGRKMLSTLLMRDACEGVLNIQTTITLDNQASWALFRSFARRADSVLTHEPYFIEDDHFDGEHATEHMVTIRLAADKKLAA